MNERAKIAVKSPETKRGNTISKAPKNGSYKSVNSPIDHILFLQRTIGNQAVQRLFNSGIIQPKLTISRHEDSYEQEADRAADNTQLSLAPLVQCKAADSSIDEVLKREEGEAAAGLQAKREGAGMSSLSEGISGGLPVYGGQPIPVAIRSRMESHIGHDFSGVRVHDGSEAHEFARRAGARAMTADTNIYFGAGWYRPDTVWGRGLLAHELTHVVQQTDSKSNRHIGTSNSLSTSNTAPHISNISNSTVGGFQGVTVQRKEGIGALDIAQAVVDPKSLLGKLWLGLSQPVKAKWVDKAIDAALRLIDEFPGRFIVGGMWEFIKKGLKGFYGKLKLAAEDVKIRTVDKIATIMAGRDEAFIWAYLKGILKGFFIDGALGIFIAIWDLIKGIGKLWDFLKDIGDAIGRFPEDMERLLQSFVKVGQDLAANIEPAMNELKKLVFDKQQAGSFIAVIVEKGKGLAKKAGEKIADSLLNFFSKPEASADIGETIGNITGQVLWEVVFAALTAGGGAAVTGIKSAARAVGKLVGKVVTGILKVVEEIHLAFGKVVEWVKGALKFVKGKLSELGSRFTKLLEDVGEFLGKLLRNCHESKITCPTFGKAAKTETRGVTKGQHGAGLSVELTEKQAQRLKRVSEALKDETKWGNVSAKDRWRLGRVYDKLMESLIGEGIKRAGGKVLHYAEVDATLIGKLRAARERVLITEGRLSSKGLRFDMLEIDFAKGRAELLDFAATSSPGHLAKTRDYKTALEKLLKLPVEAKELLYTGPKGELLETLVEVPVK